MKYTKKLLSLVLVLVLALALAVPGMAATITITNAVEGQHYNAYKIFDVSKSGSNYSYTIDSGEYDEESATYGNPWFATVQAFATEENGMTLTRIAGTTKYTVSVTDTFTAGIEGKAGALAAALNDAFLLMSDEVKPDPDGSVQAKGPEESTEVTEDGVEAIISDLTPGYYFVDSSLGALCVLNTTTDNVDITEKNDKPTIDKTADTGSHDVSKNIGDTVTYTITLTIGGALGTEYTVHDTMTDGLDFKSNTVKVTTGAAGTGTPVDTKNYTPDYEPEDGHTFDIVFNTDYTDTLAAGSKIYIQYEAVINENADTGKVNPETNKAILDYGESSDQTEEPTKLYTYAFDVIKTTEDGTLLGNDSDDYAVFNLYKKGSNDKIKLYYDETDGYYRPAVSEDEKKAMTTDLNAYNGQLKIYGLARGEYELQEYSAPKGYNVFESRITVDLTDDNRLWTDTNKNNKYDADEGGYQVINKTGAVLPGTGGMGTTIFYTLGGVLVVGAAILLVTKKRVHDVEG